MDELETTDALRDHSFSVSSKKSVTSHSFFRRLGGIFTIIRRGRANK